VKQRRRHGALSQANRRTATSDLDRCGRRAAERSQLHRVRTGRCRRPDVRDEAGKI